jgi:hypothetical protein
VACEFSGIVRDAFAAVGWDAWSCDLLPTERPGQHLQGDAREHLGDGWDVLIAHPPCTDLAASGARWWAAKGRARQDEAAALALAFWSAPVGAVAVENPVGALSRYMGRPAQVIQPWEHGHGETKGTALWLRGLLPLVPSAVVEGREQRVHRMPPSPDRWRERSRTFPGIAAAMAAQWGGSVRQLGLGL